MKEVTRVAVGVLTGGLSEVANLAVGAFSPKAPKPQNPVQINADDEDKTAAEETEAEARKRRRGVLRRVFTQPGQNFVQQSQIGKNSILGV